MLSETCFHVKMLSSDGICPCMFDINQLEEETETKPPMVDRWLKQSNMTLNLLSYSQNKEQKKFTKW